MADHGQHVPVCRSLRGIRRGQVRRGQVVAAPGSRAPRTRFTATVFLLPAAEGGRPTPIATGYRPQFFVRTASGSGLVDLGEAGTARPGDQVDVLVELGRPVALDRGLGFVIREGGQTVGAGDRHRSARLIVTHARLTVAATPPDPAGPGRTWLSG